MIKTCPLIQDDCQSSCAWYHESKKICLLSVIADRIDDIPVRLSEIDSRLTLLVDQNNGKQSS